MNKVNFLIDAGIFAAFLAAAEPRLTGINWHEWLSVALAATIIAHLLLHWRWITNIVSIYFRKLWHVSRLKFIVDLLLFAAFTGVMVSGLMISRSVLPFLGIQAAPDRTWNSLHSLTAQVSVILLGVHFALNWEWVTGMIKTFFRGVFRKSEAAGTQPALMTVPEDRIGGQS
jgi:hypothetical protein